jgi:hypothetical protein
MTKLKVALLTSCISLIACGATNIDAKTKWAEAQKLQSLSGTYFSPKVESWYGGYGTREFVLKDGQWSLIFTHALDPSMTQRTFQFRTGGSYKVNEASNLVKGAYNTVFTESWKHLTLLTDNPQIIAGMGMSECALKTNLEADISTTGCAGWRPVSVCDKDHDLFAMDAAGVYFGERPADNNMCTADKRPTALLSPVVSR